MMSHNMGSHDTVGVIANVGIGRVRYTPEYSVICSIGKRPFHGALEIEFEPGGVLLEYESFERWLGSLALEEMTIEGLVRRVFDVLSGALGEVPLRVTAHARTTVHAPVSATMERTRDAAG